MTTRRDILVGVACAAALGGAEALRPRRRQTLLRGVTLAEIVPDSVGAWISRDVGDLVAPTAQGGLAARLYGEVVERVYQETGSGREIMVLLAYGGTQSNDLQLHRPETCYPAFGFHVSASRPQTLALSSRAPLPARSLVAEAPGRRECVFYWTRLGEFLPVDDDQQRLARLQTAMAGYVSDGVLARFSILADDVAAGLAVVTPFAKALVSAVAPIHRSALIGTRLAALMASG